MNRPLLNASLLTTLLTSLVGCGSTPALPVDERPPPSSSEEWAPTPVDAAGPIPDFARMSLIATHAEVEDIAPGLTALLGHLFGPHHQIDHRQARTHEDDEPGELDDTLIWKRDYQPIYVREFDGSTTAVTYLAPNPNRQLAPFDHRTGIGRRVMPLVHENGNLVTTGKLVFVTDRVFVDNAEFHQERHLLKAGYRPRTKAEVLWVLARHLRRPTSDFVVLPPMPYEATGHIDLFLLPLDERHVMVPRIEARALAALDEGLAKNVGRVVRTFLDEQAARLRELDLDVLRLPMLPPAIAMEEDDTGVVDEETFELLVFTPANALLAHVSTGRHVVLPGFDDVAVDPAVRALSQEYRHIWQRTFRQLGWTPHVADASKLAAHLGLLRCVSASIPELTMPTGLAGSHTVRSRPRGPTPARRSRATR